MTKRIFSNNSDFIKASLAYIIAHVIDYLLTVQATMGTMLKDGNPMIRQYMDLFGTQNGLLAYKLLICGSVILGMKAVDLSHRKGKTKFRGEYVLYGGVIVTVLGGCLWLLPYSSTAMLLTLLPMTP
jgi:hypothetical protein